LGTKGFHLPLTQVWCHYLLFRARNYQMRLLFVETEVEYVKRASVKFRYTIWDEAHERELTEGWTIHACINAQGKIIRLPWDMIHIIEEGMEKT
jgi:acyl-CoA thioester hydrolase